MFIFTPELNTYSMGEKIYTRDDLERIAMMAYIKGMSSKEELHNSTRFKVPVKPFSVWLAEVLNIKSDKDATKENN